MRKLLILVALVLATVSNADADVITFDTAFDISDEIQGEAIGLNAEDSLTIETNDFRVGDFSLPRFDSNLGQLDSVTLAVDFDSSGASIPIGFSGSGGAATTAVLDSVSLRRGLVVAFETGGIRPTVISSQLQTLSLQDLNSNGFLTGSSPSQQISIPTGAVGFAADDTITDPLAPVEFSFIGDEEFDFRFRTINELLISLDQDGQDVNVAGGIVEYSGRISVSYSFTAVPEPSSAFLLLAPAMLVAVRRNRRLFQS